MQVQKNKAFAYRVPIGDYNYLQWIIVELMLQDGWMEPIQQLWEKMS